MILDFTSYANYDTKRCGETGKEFYLNVLGLEEIEKPDALKKRSGFWMRAGNEEIRVGTEEGFDRLTTKSHIAYLVEDLSRWKRKLGKQGIQTIEGAPIPGYDRFEFRDPFGNRVEMIEEIKRSI